jgi:hypothetical protein
MEDVELHQKVSTYFQRLQKRIQKLQANAHFVFVNAVISRWMQLVSNSNQPSKQNNFELQTTNRDPSIQQTASTHSTQSNSNLEESDSISNSTTIESNSNVNETNHHSKENHVQKNEQENSKENNFSSIETKVSSNLTDYKKDFFEIKEILQSLEKQLNLKTVELPSFITFTANPPDQQTGLCITTYPDLIKRFDRKFWAHKWEQECPNCSKTFSRLVIFFSFFFFEKKNLNDEMNSLELLTLIFLFLFLFL